MSHVNGKHRRGTVLVAALVCLVVVMALLGHMLVGALRTGRQMRLERERRQCELLLQAGLDRAALRIAADARYPGEVLKVPAAEIGGLSEGQVTIQISPNADSPPHIRVLAEYPLGSEQSIRRSHSVVLPSNNPSSQE